MRLLPLLCVALLAAGCYDSRFGNAATTPRPSPSRRPSGSCVRNSPGRPSPSRGHRGVGARNHQRLRREFLPHVLHRRGRSGDRGHGGHRPPAQRFPGGLPGHAQAQGPGAGRKPRGIAGRADARRRKRFRDRLHRVESGAGRSGDPQRGGAGTHCPYPAVARRTDAGAMRHAGTDRGAKLHPEDLTPGTWAGYKRFTDDTGAAVYTYVRSYARFADDEVPVGRCTLTGILQYDATGEGRYILKLRDENDWAVNRLPAISRTALRTAVSVVLALTALAGCDKGVGAGIRRRHAAGDGHDRCAQIALHGSTGRRHGGHHDRRRGDGQRPLRRILQNAGRRRHERRDFDSRGRHGTLRRLPGRHGGHDPLQRAVPVRLRRQGNARHAPHGRICRAGEDTPGGGGAVPAAEAGGNQAPTASDVHVRGGRHAAYRHLRAFRRGTVRAAGQLVRPRSRDRTPRDDRTADRGSHGTEFIVRTAGTCTYATEPVPQGTGSVYGIIDYFNGKYTLRIANREVDFATVAARPTACPSSGGYSAPKPTR